MIPAEQIREKYTVLGPLLNERQCRLWAALEARSLGRGGVTLVAQATGVSRKRIQVGLQELADPEQATPASAKPRRERIRRSGGGRPALAVRDPGLCAALEALVAPATRGDPMAPLRWTSKSTAKLAAELTAQGHPVSPRTVATLLQELDYSLQGMKKTTEGHQHADRDAQFQYISAKTTDFQRRAQPVVSVDTKKKELVGDFHNRGREWQPEGQPAPARCHDFPDPAWGKAIPHGVYDPTTNEGWVSVGTDHDTSAFAVQSIRGWWTRMGRERYPEATELLITADGGGSNDRRRRQWKTELQGLATETGLAIAVCHFPPGTSQWNQIEHRMFCHLTQNWRGRPLISHEVIVNLIGSTTTKTGLTIQAVLDTESYPTQVQISDEEFAAVRLERDEFHGEWNYTIRPSR